MRRLGIIGIQLVVASRIGAAQPAADAQSPEQYRALVLALKAAADVEAKAAAESLRQADKRLEDAKAKAAALAADSNATVAAKSAADAEVDAAQKGRDGAKAIEVAALSSSTLAQQAVDKLPAAADPESKTKTKADVANLRALTTLPQLTALKGGSLGIPSSGVISGLQASIDARILGDQAKTDAFAQLGGIQLRENASVDVFAEVLAQDVPRYTRDSGSVEKAMFDARVSAAGIRARFRTRAVQWVTKLDDPKCSAALSKQSGTESTLTKLRGDEQLVKDSTKDGEKSCNVNNIEGVSFATLTLGARVLRRSASEADGEASDGGAVEALLQYESPKLMLHGGVTGWRLGDAAEPSGSATFEFPRLDVLRASAGFEYRGSKATDGTDIVPRVGVYGVLSHAWWTDPYTFGTIDGDVESTEAEVGVYAGGKFSEKFSGVVAFRVVRPLCQRA